jgi:hypothetical protein
MTFDILGIQIRDIERFHVEPSGPQPILDVQTIETDVVSLPEPFVSDCGVREFRILVSRATLGWNQHDGRTAWLKRSAQLMHSRSVVWDVLKDV